MSTTGDVGPADGSEQLGGPGGTLTADFFQAVGRELGSATLTPTALARAVARLLPVDAAGITTMAHVLRLPLGASSAAALHAEELQSTLGDGPCLTGAATRSAYVADLDAMLRRWPLYGEELLAATPFRSVATVPLQDPAGGVFAALDLYAEDAHLSERLDLPTVVAQVAAPLAALMSLCMSAVLDAESHPDAELPLPAWYRSATARRHAVWVAVGMLMGLRRQPGEQALSLLRGYAFSHDRSLDDVADDLVGGRLRASDLLDRPDAQAPDD